MGERGRSHQSIKRLGRRERRAWLLSLDGDDGDDDGDDGFSIILGYLFYHYSYMNRWRRSHSSIPGGCRAGR